MNVLVVLEPDPDSVSEQSLAPLDWAMERARRATDRVVVVLVGHVFGPATDALELRAQARLRSWEGLSHLRRAQGQPDRAVLRVLGHEPFDELVLEGGRRTPAGKIQPGTLVERLLLDAPITITLVR
jgi:hypothetical protein